MYASPAEAVTNVAGPSSSLYASSPSDPSESPVGAAFRDRRRAGEGDGASVALRFPLALADGFEGVLLGVLAALALRGGIVERAVEGQERMSTGAVRR
jgi:hypothetical protein